MDFHVAQVLTSEFYMRVEPMCWSLSPRHQADPTAIVIPTPLPSSSSTSKAMTSQVVETIRLSLGKKKGGTIVCQFPLQLKIRHGSNRHQDLARRILHSRLFSLRQAKVLLPREFSHENPLMGTSASLAYLGLAKRVVVLGRGNKEMEHHRMACCPYPRENLKMIF